MYRTLFDIAGLAMLGWLLLIFLPTWRVTRRVAESAVFPVFLCVLYLVGVATVFREMGFGIMGDFGSADGVLGLLSTEPVALVAWIHILAFDQLAGVLIYRDNMRHRFVPLPVQSVLLVATLMLGPLGFLSYWAIRVGRSRRPVAWGEREREPEPVIQQDAARAPVVAPQFRAVVPAGSVAGAVTALLRRNPMIVGSAVAGFLMAVISTAVAAVNGQWQIGAEGRLLEAVKFDVALGIFILTLALILPLAPFSEHGRRRWTRWLTGLALYAYLVENVQAWRGLDPRFSSIAGTVDQAIGGIFFLSALGILVLFSILIARFFRENALPDHAPLRLALRYAAGAAFLAFGVGIAMSVIYSGRAVAPAGNLMPLHAAGFHGIQAVPLVALLVGGTLRIGLDAERWVHMAGIGWLALCLGMAVQAFSGQPPLELSPALITSAAGALAWIGALAVGIRGRVSPAPSMA